MVEFLRAIKRKLGLNPVAWIFDARRMRAIAQAYHPDKPVQPPKQHLLVVVSPWDFSAVPWFTLTMGLLQLGDGQRVTFAIDGMRFGPTSLAYRFAIARIRWVVRPLRRRFTVVDVVPCKEPRNIPEETDTELNRIAELNAIWLLRGEIVEEKRRAIIEKYHTQLRQAYGAIADVVRADKFDTLFVPGGIWGNSSIWLMHARAAGMRVATFDSGGYGTLMLTTSGIACQLQDIPRAFEMVKQRCDTDAAENRYVVEAAEAELARRRAGTDKFSSQIQGTEAPKWMIDGAVVIALNSSWDGAALGLHGAYSSNTEWIVGTVRYLLEHTDRPVIVRQHPAERLAIARTSDDYDALLRTHFGHHPRIIFVAAADPVNSYALMERASAIVVYTSTVGIEAVVCSKPVVTEGNAYYSDLGFIWKGKDEPSYLALLGEAAAGRLTVTPERHRDALICYYLTQCHNWVFTDFNPSDFKLWSCRSLEELSKDPVVRRTIVALRDDLPISYVQHMEAWKARAASS